MSRNFLPGLLGLAILCGACAPQDVGVSEVDPQDVPARRAFFAANPADLDAAFQASCGAPGDVFTRPNRQTARCNIPPSPESAAFLLIGFDAELAPPRIVVEKVTRPASGGFEVEVSYFAEVLRKSGAWQRVYIRNRMLDRQIDRFLAVAGGDPMMQPE